MPQNSTLGEVYKPQDQQDLKFDPGEEPWEEAQQGRLTTPRGHLQLTALQENCSKCSLAQQRPGVCSPNSALLGCPHLGKWHPHLPGAQPKPE